MIEKEIVFSIDPDSIQILDGEILKTASDNNILAGHKFDPDFVYVLVRAVSAGEYWGPNNNIDYFEESELLGNNRYGHQTGYPTFMEAHVFKNHANKDVAGAIGSVLKAEWDDFMKAVNLLITIDKEIAPTIARGFLKSTITDVSMGCRVDHVVCSICGRRAKVRRDYCEHLRDPNLRGKILEGGKRVYEVNKGPRFHDISVVTKGADRTAKAARVIDGQKAFLDGGIQKAASIQDKLVGIKLDPRFELPSKCKYNDRGFDKVAKEVSMMKKAEIEKIITGNIISVVGNKAMENASEKASEVMDIMRLFHTKNFDKDTTDKIAENINIIAKEQKRNPSSVFKTFLRTAELAGIELTPLEFGAIKLKLERKDSKHLFDLSRTVGQSMPSDSMRTVIRVSRGVGLPRNPDFSFPGPELRLEQDMFRRILSPFMEDRSTQSRFMHPRIISVINMPADRARGNLDQFILPLASLSKEASEDMKNICKDYASYQDERAKMNLSGEIGKYASLVDGEYKSIIKEAMSGRKQFKPDIRKQYLLNKDYVHLSSDNLIGVIDPFLNKEATDEENIQTLFKQAFDMPGNFNELGVFSSQAINSLLLNDYSADNIAIMKQAMIEYFKGDEYEKDSLLKQAGLSDADINSYLKIAANLITIELEKIAGVVGDVAKDTAIDTLFYPSIGAGFGAMLPGSIIDGFVFNKAINHFEKKSKKKALLQEPSEKPLTDPIINQTKDYKEVK